MNLLTLWGTSWSHFALQALQRNIKFVSKQRSRVAYQTLLQGQGTSSELVIQILQGSPDQLYDSNDEWPKGKRTSVIPTTGPAWRLALRQLKTKHITCQIHRSKKIWRLVHFPTMLSVPQKILKTLKKTRTDKFTDFPYKKEAIK